MRDELVEAVKVAILTAIVEHGVPTDIQEHLVRGDGRGTVLPGALDRMAQAALAVAEPAIRERCAKVARDEADRLRGVGNERNSRKLRATGEFMRASECDRIATAICAGQGERG